MDERVGRRDGKELIWQQHVGSWIRKERDTRMDRRREGDKTEDGMMTSFAECVFFTTHTGIEIKTGVKKVERNVKHKGEGGYDVITGWVLEDTRDGEMMQQKQREVKMADGRGGGGFRGVRSEIQP